MKLTKIALISLAFASLAFAFEIQAQIPASSSGSEDASPVIPGGSASNGGEDAGVPATSPSNGNEGVLVPPSSPSNGNEGSIIPASAPSNGEEAPVVPSGGSGNSSEGQIVPVSSSSGSRSSYVFNSAACLKGFLKRSWNNDSAEVAKLQNFLKTAEGLDVDVNGIFDQKTEDAVKKFQEKYRSIVLDPWSKTAQPTGVVYITTFKKINQLVCGSPLTLNADELNTINSYGINPVGAEGQTIEPIVGAGPFVPGATLASGQGTSSASTASVQDDNTASVGRAGILQKFWGFVKSLFE